eukprot:c25900_g1_i1 orf=80-430(+)
MMGDGQQQAMHARGGDEEAPQRMHAAVLAELRELERNVRQQIEAASPPGDSPIYNQIKLTITNRMAATQARIHTLLGDLNKCLGAPPSQSDASTSRPAITVVPPPPSRPRKVAFVC